MEKYYLAIFAIVAVVGGVLLVTNSMNPVDTGMVSGINTPQTNFVGPPIIGESPRNIVGGDARDMQFRSCMGICLTNFNTCEYKADSYWDACMGKASASVCDTAYDRAIDYCSRGQASCESRCGNLFK